MRIYLFSKDTNQLDQHFSASNVLTISSIRERFIYHTLNFSISVSAATFDGQPLLQKLVKMTLLSIKEPLCVLGLDVTVKVI
jgi:hypothetical protein